MSEYFFPHLQSIESDSERGVTLLATGIAFQAERLGVEVTPEFAEKFRQQLLITEAVYAKDAPVAFCLRLAAQGDFEKAGREILGHISREGAALKGFQVAVMTTKERQSANGKQKTGYRAPIKQALTDFSIHFAKKRIKKDGYPPSTNCFIESLDPEFADYRNDGSEARVDSKGSIEILLIAKNGAAQIITYERSSVEKYYRDAIKTLK